MACEPLFMIHPYNPRASGFLALRPVLYGAVRFQILSLELLAYKLTDKKRSSGYSMLIPRTGRQKSLPQLSFQLNKNTKATKAAFPTLFGNKAGAI